MKVNVVLAEQWLASPFRSTKEMGEKSKGLASYCKADTTFTFYFSIINA